MLDAIPLTRTSSLTWCGSSRNASAEDVRLAADTRRHSDTLGRKDDGARRSATICKTEVAQPVPHALSTLPPSTSVERVHRQDQPASDFTVVYHLLSYERNADVRIKVALAGDAAVAHHGHGSLACRELVRARSLGHVRHHLRGASAPAAHPDAADLGGPSPAQGPSRPRDGNGPVRSSREQGGRGAGGAALSPEEWGLRAPQRDRRVHVPQPRPAASRHTRRACASCCSSTARRSSMRCPISAITTAAPRRWASASPGTPTSPTPTASIISAA